ncbi:LuxR C-terminal-related transcriptional regulator [Amycolatopsis kentuckyensis]|uniref:LuxR C-terminal-related transcriptional regulator n=1 Tax=Amycolatopsis kentuckyensis TaxID=218823 RepID=UPI0035654E4B
MISVAAVDDHPLILRGLQAYLSEHADDIDLCAVYPAVSAMLASPVTVSVVLLDLLLPDERDVTENVRRIRSAGAEVVIYTSDSRPGIVREALDAGALGLVLKGDPEERVVDSIRDAAEGRKSYSSRLAHAIVTDPRAVVRLAAREREVLTLIAKGMPRRLIAKQLGISEKTLPTYLKRVDEKYAKARNASASPGELAAFALQDGYIELPPDPPAG